MFFKLKVYTAKFTNLLGTIVQYGCISYCFTEYVANISICSGPSMEPTLSTSDVIISEHISVKKLQFNYGDIVISKSPIDPKEYICKRITGLPGDKIRINPLKTLYVPRGHVWLEGDNRDNSSDSRHYGPVPQGLIRGRVICKIWPFTDVTMLTVRSE